ncbi:hypothetical protein NDU88_001399 [Pleurodeles waltl]|uniref:Uncharacterized protein n=1 Tax=Pleurodeles waltl TaxID=8319 RepID=A0AAV7KPE0_PLEWA|nr:hypothetical protein NDU88_001399 [Pleurodeles waltl]
MADRDMRTALNTPIDKTNTRHEADGVLVGDIQEGISLYADDIPQILRNPGIAWRSGRAMITKVVVHSRFKLDMNKSILYPMQTVHALLRDLSNIQVQMTSFKYSRIYLSSYVVQTYSSNVSALLDSLERSVHKRRRFPLSLVGRVAISKMIMIL